jgi:glycine dehydrogenase subunit 1
MPFIPHSEEEICRMLDAIGARDIEDLFGEIPPHLRHRELAAVPEGMSEMEIGQLMRARAEEDGGAICFAGAGAYEHHIPEAVWQLATRGELYSAYTPYQAEASQGTLQLLYEYQSMMSALTAMDVSNASLYDGASALAEAVLMAVRANRSSRSRRVLMPQSVHPRYRKVVRTIVGNQGIEIQPLAFDVNAGHTDPDLLERHEGEDIAALVVPQPNFFGVLEEVGSLTGWAHRNGALVIGLVNPLLLALLEPPGEWGDEGADIACGDGQPLGLPLSSGGPYLGFLCSKASLVRQMPGRIVGRTLDLEGRPGFTLTLQAREQHIRRSRATSNICTNQGLMVTAATIHMAILGVEGLARAAARCHANTLALVGRLTQIEGVTKVFRRPLFHEAVLRVQVPAREVLRSLAAHNVVGGYALEKDYPDLGEALLVCASEMRTRDDIEAYASRLERIMTMRRTPGCPVKPKI